MTRVLITGASGFIGAALRARLQGVHEIRAASRRAGEGITHVVGDLGASTDWRRALEGVDALVHLAGPAHAAIDENLAQRAIAEAVAALSRQAAEAGIRRFVYLSSIRAGAHRSTAPLAEDARPAPNTAYGRAKLAAEQAVSAHAAFSPIILRPPLVHAPHAGGNWGRFMQLAASGLPAPFASLDNRRSVIALDSLLDALVATIDAPSAAAGLYHVADEPAVSIATMLSTLREGMGKPAGLFSAGAIARALPSQLRENLEINSSRFRATFAWSGADTREALIACGRAWRARP